MQSIEVKNFLESRTDVPVYPLEFPESVNEGCLFDVTTTGNTNGDVSEVMVSIYSRAAHPSRAEIINQGFMDSLNKLTDFNIGSTKVIMVRTQGKIPTYSGKDEQGRFYFVSDYRFLVE